MEHAWGCDYALVPIPADAECYCPMPGEQGIASCGCLVDACCDCAES